MGVAKFGVWFFFSSRKDAEVVSNEFSSIGNRYKVFVLNVKVLSDNSIRFYVCDERTAEGLTWLVNCDYCFIYLKKNWELRSNVSGFGVKANNKLKEVNKVK